MAGVSNVGHLSVTKSRVRFQRVLCGNGSKGSWEVTQGLFQDTWKAACILDITEQEMGFPVRKPKIFLSV